VPRSEPIDMPNTDSCSALLQSFIFCVQHQCLPSAQQKRGVLDYASCQKLAQGGHSATCRGFTPDALSNQRHMLLVRCRSLQTIHQQRLTELGSTLQAAALVGSVQTCGEGEVRMLQVMIFASVNVIKPHGARCAVAGRLLQTRRSRGLFLACSGCSP